MPPNVVLALTSQSSQHQVPKFHRATPPNSEVISAPILQLKSIFDPPLKKIVRGAPVPCGGCVSKTWSFSSTCKNLGAQHPLGAEIWFSEKGALCGYDFTSVSYTHLTLPTKRIV